MKHIPDILAFLGAGLVVYGLWRLHPSAAFIGGGSLLLFLGVKKQMSGKP